MTDLEWDLLSRYTAGQCSAAECQRVERLMATDRQVAMMVAAVRDVAEDGDAASTAERRELRLARIKQAGASPVEAPAHARPIRLVLPVRRRTFVGIAASALLAASATAWWMANHRTQSPDSDAARPAYSVVTTTLGQRLSLRFSDGTTVTLGPGSTLRTPATYGRPDRAVELEGEAVFTVAHDSTRPFTVRTERMVAIDLGTRFLVRAYRDDTSAEVVVAEGRVAVRAAASAAAAAVADSVLLGVGELVRLDADGRLLHSRHVPLGDYFDWIDGALVFRDAALGDVARRLGRWYDIEIRIVSDRLSERTLRASIGRESALDALQMIAASLDLRLSRAGRVYTLTEN